MRLKAELSLPQPAEPVSIMAALAAHLLTFRPYLDLLARVLEGTLPTAAGQVSAMDDDPTQLVEGTTKI